MENPANTMPTFLRETVHQGGDAAAAVRQGLWPQIYHHPQLPCFTCLSFLPGLSRHLSFLPLLELLGIYIITKDRVIYS
jgi:hypothetical protein